MLEILGKTSYSPLESRRVIRAEDTLLLEISFQSKRCQYRYSYIFAQVELEVATVVS